MVHRRVPPHGCRSVGVLARHQGHGRDECDGGNTAFVAAAFDGMRGLLGDLHEESYVFVHAADCDAYGYGGRTQNERWTQAHPGREAAPKTIKYLYEIFPLHRIVSNTNFWGYGALSLHLSSKDPFMFPPEAVIPLIEQLRSLVLGVMRPLGDRVRKAPPADPNTS